MKKPLIPALAICVLLAAALTATTHAASIVIVNNDGAGEGFNDPTPVAPVGGNWGTTLGQQRLIAFTYAANIWGACLQSNVTITVRAQMDPQFCDATSAVLGSAGTTTVHRDFAGAPLAATWYSQALANSLAGVDLDPGNPDINATFNSNLNGAAGCLGGIGWYYGLDQNPGGNIDFVSVVEHEIGHGLGFQTFVSQGGAKFLGFNDQYMVYLENHGAVPSDYPSMSNAQRAAANIADPDLHWIGPLVTAQGNAILSGGLSGGHVRMHGPNPYQPGSSVSHWSNALTPNELLEPFYTGANHEPGLAWTLMDEIGWTLAPKQTDGCHGAVLDLASPTGSTVTTGGAGSSFQERGVFVTALKEFSLCSIGVKASLVPGENLTASIYEADGVTRGALLASITVPVEFAGDVTHYVPISYVLNECEEYDIVVEWENVVSWTWWNELSMTQRPYDVGGVIRVRDGEANADPTNAALGHFTLQGLTPVLPMVSVLENAPFSTCTDGSTNRGAFITAAKTLSVCAVGFEVEYAAPVVLTANIYNAVGLVRGSLLATGTLQVFGGGGLSFYNIPVNAVLFEGRDYEIEILYPVAVQWGCISEGGAPVPFTVDDAITVVNGTASGNPANTILPHLLVGWDEGPGLGPLDITLPWLGVPDGTSNVSTAFGKYVSSLHAQDLTGLGFYADLAPGATVTANVYSATGTTRGAIISTGSVTTGPAGLRWHDIPVAATLASGQDYDLEIDWSAATANGFPYWVDVGAQQPYNAYGLLSIVVGEFGGIPDAATECAQFRVYSCATGPLTAAGPVATPKFTLHDAFPNPFSGTATLGYELDEAATVSVQMFDVAGRKVADVMKSKSLPAGPGEFTLDAGRLPSGVYFVKMSTPSKSVTRKITILR
jgi:hypothetical protein